MTNRPQCSLALMMLSAVAGAQNTVPHFAGWLGGPEREEGTIVRRGPGGDVWLVGHVRSTGLQPSGMATPGAYQTSNHSYVGAGALPGAEDVFVARIDPATSQILWCTYLGGSGTEFAFDAHVDSAGVVTVAGLTASPDFPTPTGTVAVNGPSDGFVAQLDPTGSTLLSSMLYGGSNDDHVCELEVDAATGSWTIAGATSSPDLPQPRRGTLRGPSDAFVARVVVGAGVVWSTYVGGGSSEGWVFSTWLGTLPNAAYEGNLERIGLTLAANGDPVVATTSFTNGSPPVLLVPGVYAGAGDTYLARLDAGTGVERATMLWGGSDNEFPKSVVAHPRGGFVVCGASWSPTLPGTAGALQPTPRAGALGNSDGFVAWLEPGTMTTPSITHYATFLGGNGGESVAHDLTIESSGVVTCVGHTGGGDFAASPRSLQGGSGTGQTWGFVTRIEPTGRAALDLVHATWVGAPNANSSVVVRSAVLDEVGDVWFAGGTNSAVAMPGFSLGWLAGRNAFLAHLPLLPGGQPGVCVARSQLAAATPACGYAPYTGMADAPLPGRTVGFTVTGAPPSSLGALVLGPPAPPIPVLNGNLLIAPPTAILTLTDTLGYARQDLPIPAAIAPLSCWGLGAQWLVLCPGGASMATTERLDF